MVKGRINHMAMTVSDLAASEERFYRSVLSFFGYEKVEDIPGKMVVWFNAEAQTAINLWQAEPELQHRRHERYAPGFHHCAFAVENRAEVDRLYGFLQEQGIRVLDPPAEYPHYAPGYYAVYFEDGDGLKFEAVHMPIIPT